MRVQIAMLSGIVDIHTLFGVFMLTGTTMLFGWLMELLNGERLTTYAANGAELLVCCSWTHGAQPIPMNAMHRISTWHRLIAPTKHKHLEHVPAILYACVLYWCQYCGTRAGANIVDRI